jgi:rhodanese-related sulfurtransferase
LGLAVLVGIFYNLSNPGKIPFIGEENPINFSQSDSLLNLFMKQDSIQRVADSLKRVSIHVEDSIKLVDVQRAKDSLMEAIRQDSLKHVNDSLRIVKKRIDDSLLAVKQNQENFVKPVDIRLDFAKALFDKEKSCTFVDARDEADYRAGSIKGAINIPYHDIDKFKDKLNSMPKNKLYVCYCSSACDVSIDLAYAMAKMGFTKVYIFHGGWDEWKAAGYPTN